MRLEISSARKLLTELDEQITTLKSKRQLADNVPGGAGFKKS